MKPRYRRPLVGGGQPGTGTLLAHSERGGGRSVPHSDAGGGAGAAGAPPPPTPAAQRIPSGGSVSPAPGDRPRHPARPRGGAGPAKVRARLAPAGRRVVRLVPGRAGRGAGGESSPVGALPLRHMHNMSMTCPRACRAPHSSAPHRCAHTQPGAHTAALWRVPHGPCYTSAAPGSYRPAPLDSGTGSVGYPRSGVPKPYRLSDEGGRAPRYLAQAEAGRPPGGGGSLLDDSASLAALADKLFSLVILPSIGDAAAHDLLDMATLLINHNY